MTSLIVSQNITQVNTKSEPYQLHNRAEILALADFALQQWQRQRAAFLATGDATAWRLAQAAEADRAALLGEVGA